MGTGHPATGGRGHAPRAFTGRTGKDAGKDRIGVVFRENEAERIYGVTFIDHNRREAFNGSRMGKEFSANVFNELFRWWDGIPDKELREHTSGELWQSYRHKVENGSALEQAAGILSMELTQPSITRKRRSAAA